jgi:hypothetical protein
LNENHEDVGDVEEAALEQGANVSAQADFNELKAFKESAASSASLQASSEPGKGHVADNFLKSFAHLMRIGFHRQPSMQSLYTSLSTSVNAPGATAMFGGKRQLKVALHIRRGDSCEGGIVNASSQINAPAMTTPRRKCYDVSVYAEALRRIYEKFQAPLEIYLSTDSNGEILKELTGSRNTSTPSLVELTNTDAAVRLHRMIDSHEKTVSSILQAMESKYPQMYQTSSWRILNYSRSLFGYKGTVEFTPDQDKAFLLESGIQDLWHLSHGEVFVGHLSSRFGKVAYLLAVARQNSPIPYISPDGHNLCCEVDEECADATNKMTTMADCLLFAHEMQGQCKGDYWTEGCKNRVPVEW